MRRSAEETIRNLEQRIARLEGKTASSGVRRAGQKVLKAIDELQDELRKMPSYNSNDPYYEALRERFEELKYKASKEVQFITGAY
jgi:uncharacterized coiled-coil DUF342 family protein